MGWRRATMKMAAGNAVPMVADSAIIPNACMQVKLAIVTNMIWNLVLRRNINWHVVNKHFRQSVIDDNNLSFDDEVTIYEDVIWTYKYYSYKSSLLIVPALTYNKEINKASITHTTDKKARKTLESRSSE